MSDREKLIVASAGGGNVGIRLLKSVVRAFGLIKSDDCRLQVFTGPFLNTEDFDELKKAASVGVVVERFTPDFISYLAAADLSVSMGGYNTTMNILATGVPSLLGPFSQNREQRLRAGRLAKRGLLTILEDADLQPDRMAAKMDRELAQSNRPAVSINLDGAAKTAACIGDWPANYGEKSDEC